VSGEDTRQRINGGCRPLTVAALCRVLLFDTRQTWSLPSVILCRVFGTRQTTFLPSAICLPSAFSLALDKQPLYRVPDKNTWQSLGHSTKKPSPVVSSLLIYVAISQTLNRICRMRTVLYDDDWWASI